MAAKTLQSARLRIMSESMCGRHYPNQITPGQHLCAGGDSANSADACKVCNVFLSSKFFTPLP